MKHLTAEAENQSTITITLSSEAAAALKDYAFWFRVSTDGALVSKIVNRWMEDCGEGNMWDQARDPQKRAAAFAHAGLSDAEIAKWNTSLDGTFKKLNRETARINGPVRRAKAQAEKMSEASFIKGCGIRLD